jgi:hypothetical protein
VVERYVAERAAPQHNVLAHKPRDTPSAPALSAVEPGLAFLTA